MVHKSLHDPEVQQLLTDPNHAVTITYIRPDSNLLTSIPVWTLHNNSKFYVISSRKSVKIDALDTGNTNFSLVIVNKEGYPHMKEDGISYISISGTAVIITEEDRPGIADLEIKLLEKYNETDPEQWALNLIGKLRSDPRGAWMIEIDPIMTIIR